MAPFCSFEEFDPRKFRAVGVTSNIPGCDSDTASTASDPLTNASFGRSFWLATDDFEAEDFDQAGTPRTTSSWEVGESSEGDNTSSPLNGIGGSTVSALSFSTLPKTISSSPSWLAMNEDVSPPPEAHEKLRPGRRCAHRANPAVSIGGDSQHNLWTSSRESIAESRTDQNYESAQVYVANTQQQHVQVPFDHFFSQAPVWVELSSPSMPTSQASIGSMGHPFTCQLPCKYSGKRKGCKDGTKCDRCHLCVWTRARG